MLHSIISQLYPSKVGRPDQTEGCVFRGTCEFVWYPWKMSRCSGSLLGSGSLRLLRIVCLWTSAVKLQCSPRCFQVLSSSAASSTITALSPGGALMQGGTQQAINRTCWASSCYPLPKAALKSNLRRVLKLYWFSFGTFPGSVFCFYASRS